MRLSHRQVTRGLVLALIAVACAHCGSTKGAVHGTADAGETTGPGQTIDVRVRGNLAHAAGRWATLIAAAAVGAVLERVFGEAILRETLSVLALITAS